MIEFLFQHCEDHDDYTELVCYIADVIVVST